MPKIVMIMVGLQYLIWIFFNTTSTFTFGVLDLIIHILFSIQTICLLYLVYIYINWKNAQNLNEKTMSIRNTVINIIILLVVLIATLNIVNVFFWDTLIKTLNII